MKPEDVRVTGWGPDFSEVDLRCPACRWQHVISTEEDVTIGDLMAKAAKHMEENHSGELIIRLVEEDVETLTPVAFGFHVRHLVVDKADRVVSATEKLIAECAIAGYVHDDVLTVGTPGEGCGVVRYRISDHPQGPDYRTLTRIEDHSGQ
jgi:hypothetical protein